MSSNLSQSLVFEIFYINGIIIPNLCPFYYQSLPSSQLKRLNNFAIVSAKSHPKKESIESRIHTKKKAYIILYICNKTESTIYD